MSNEVVIKSGNTLSLGDGPDIEIIDHDAPIIFSDLVTEYRVNNGIFCLSFGAIHTDAKNPPQARIVARLRMGLVQAQILRDMMTNVLEDALKPIDKSQAN